MDAEALITTVATWAQRDDRIVAAALCGSYARGEAKSGSDIDFCIVCRDPDSLLNDHSWLDLLAVGARVSGAVENYGLVRSLRIFYGELEAEFGIAGVAWMDIPVDPGTARVMTDGLRILYDPEGRLQTAVASTTSPSH